MCLCICLYISVWLILSLSMSASLFIILFKWCWVVTSNIQSSSFIPYSFSGWIMTTLVHMPIPLECFFSLRQFYFSAFYFFLSHLMNRKRNSKSRFKGMELNKKVFFKKQMKNHLRCLNIAFDNSAWNLFTWIMRLDAFSFGLIELEFFCFGLIELKIFLLALLSQNSSLLALLSWNSLTCNHFPQLLVTLIFSWCNICMNTFSKIYLSQHFRIWNSTIKSGIFVKSYLRKMCPMAEFESESTFAGETIIISSVP